jgi:uncharacterized protein YndB with AHSA1/START domain
MSNKGTIGLKVEIDAPRTEVFNFLVDPNLLRQWFCDDIQIEPLVGGKFVFGGSHSFMSTFIEKSGQGRIETIDPPGLLSFSFILNGTPSVMEFRLEENGPGTTLYLTHRDIPRDSLMMDGLIVCLSNLINLVEHGKVGYRLDYLNDITDGHIQREILIEGSPEQVFKALIDRNSLSLWFSNKMQNVEPKIGGIYDVGWRNKDGKQIGPIRITNLEENHTLGYSWDYDPRGGKEVKWELLPEGEATRVRLTHEGFVPGRYNKDYYQGWHAYMLTLKSFIEKGRRPFEIIEGDWNY